MLKQIFYINTTFTLFILLFLSETFITFLIHVQSRLFHYELKKCRKNNVLDQHKQNQLVQNPMPAPQIINEHKLFNHILMSIFYHEEGKRTFQAPSLVHL